MSKYTVEQVRDIHWKMAKDYKEIPALAEPHKAMGDSIDALLRELESAKAAVTDEMVDIALTTMYGEQFADISGKAEEIFRQHMRAALEAVAPMLASARVPDAMCGTNAPSWVQKLSDPATYAAGWNACREAMLAAASKPEKEE